jgi:hypothetical protein
MAAQVYAAFYLAWFLLFGLMAAGVVTLVIGTYRRDLLKVIRRDWPFLLFAAALGAVAIDPLWRHAHAAAAELGFRSRYEVSLSVPDWRSWVYLGPHSWLYGWLPRLILFHGIPLEPEHRLGIGLITPLTAVVGLFLGRGQPGVRLAGLAGLGVWLSVTSFGKPTILGLSLTTLAACVTWLVLDPGDARRSTLLTLVTIALTAALVPLPVLGMVAPVGAVAAVVAALLWWQGMIGRPRAWTGALAAYVLLGCLVTYSDVPFIWMPTALTVVAGSIVLWRRGFSPGARPLAATALIAAVVVWILGDYVSIWTDYIFPHVFGANAIRAVGRISLLLLIPMSVGLGIALDSLSKRWGILAACALGFFCVLEQGVTTPSFDKYTQRAHAHEVAQQVPPGCEAFFANPLRPPASSWEPHLDAMWAQLECGVPTINGYSGGLPQGWFPLYEPGPNTDAALADWAARRGLDLSRICWIAGQPGARGMMRPITGKPGSGAD